MALLIRDNAKHGKIVSDEEAAAAIIRFRNNNWLQFDVNNTDHIEAYKVLRKSMGRVAPQNMEQYLKTRKPKMRHGAEDSIEFWGVPKRNFQDGLPEDIVPALMTPAFN